MVTTGGQFYDFYDPSCQTNTCPVSVAEEFFGNPGNGASADCQTGTIGGSKQTTQQQPNCDIQLLSGEIYDDFQHTSLELTELTSSGSTLTFFIEAGAFVGNNYATNTQIVTGQATLNKNPNPLTPLYPNMSSSVLWDFASNYSDLQLCMAFASIVNNYNAYTNNQISYSLLSGPNSNSFTFAMLGAGGLSLPWWLNSLMSLPYWLGGLYPGWGAPL